MACIELIGCTSAGKSTLINASLRFCDREGIVAWLGEDFVLHQVQINWIKNKVVRAVFVNLIALFVALRVRQKYSEFYKFAIWCISQLPISVKWFERLYIAKNIFKNIGIYEIVRQHISHQQFVFLDEGPLHTAQVLFVRLVNELQGIDLSTFVSLVPLPDIAVYLQRDDEVLIGRTLARKHKRIPNGSHILAKLFIKSSVAIFDKLIQYPEVELRLLKVDKKDQIFVPQLEQISTLQRTVLGIIQAGLKLVNSEYLKDSVIRE